MPGSGGDLIVFVADQDIANAVSGLFLNPRRMGVGEFSFHIEVYRGRDAGCFNSADEELRRESRRYGHALVMFDREGCGRENLSRVEIETDVENRLEASGWGERAGAVVLDPELESWIWTTSPHVARVLGWAGRESEMREYLAGKGFFRGDEVKPLRPKEAVEAALYEVRIPKSPALYLDLGKHVSHARCTDAAFLKFKSTLKAWFPPS